MKIETKEKFLEFCVKEHFDIRSPESRQHQAVFSDDKFVVPAGAGSGKTTVLTYRFLRLLMDEDIGPIHSDEILTMTFTKAATANMKSRIYRTLKKAQESGLISGEEIDRFSNAEICTTDSFCSKIARQDSIRYGIAPNFTIEEEDDYERWAENAIRTLILDRLESDEGLSSLVSWYGMDGLTSALVECGNIYYDISSPVVSEEETASRAVERYQKYIDDERGKRETTLREGISSFISSYEMYPNAEKDLKAVESFLNSYDNGTLLDFNIPFSDKYSLEKGNKELNGKYRKTKSKLNEYAKALGKMVTYSNREDSLLYPWATLLHSFYTLLGKHKREEGVLTFHDILLLSIDILKTNRKIRRLFADRFKRIMVDEFQDNNGDNKNLVYLLASKEDYDGKDYPTIDDINMRKIFMVGDEKQSIYRFRGADVSVFKKMADDAGEDRVLTLSENFRSEKSVIDRINAIFKGKIMPEYPDKDYEAQYKSLVSNVHKTSLSQMRLLYVDWKKHGKDEDRKEKSDQFFTEALGVARFIKEEVVGNGEAWPVAVGRDGGERKCTYSDIAILLRKGTHQSYFERALRYYGIPFNVSENKTLTMDAVVNDFYNVLQLTAYGTEDLLTYASYLRSPFVSMSEKGIRTVLENIREERDKEKGLDEDDVFLLSYGEDTLKGAMEIADKGNISRILTYLWIDRGYRYFIEHISGNEPYSEHYDYLFAMAASYDQKNRTLIEFLDKLRPMLGKESRLKDLTVLEETTSGVTIQTIHKSKGLEYPVVFVSDMGGRNSGGGNGDIRISPDSSLFPVIPFIPDEEGKRLVNPWEEVRKEEEEDLEKAEAKRILYVAATRAQHHLIFSGSINNEADQDSSSKTYNLLSLILKGLDFTYGGKDDPTYSYSFVDTYCNSDASDKFQAMEIEPVPLSEIYGKKKGKMEKEEDPWFKEPRILPTFPQKEKCGVTTFIEKEDFSSTLLKDEEYEKGQETEKGTELPRISIDPWLIEIDENLVTGESEEEKNEKRKELRAQRITEFGTLTHKTLEDYFKGEEDDYSSFFPGGKGQKEAILCALSLRDSFLSSSFFKETLKDFKLTPERHFMVMDGDVTVEGVIDLYCEKDDTIYIVDYKTDSIRYEKDHRNQLNYYRKAVASIKPDKKIKAAVFYLRDPKNILEIE